MLKKTYIKSNEYLFLLLPLSVIFSNFLANFTIYYISFFGLFIFFLKKKFRYLENIFVLLFIIFCIYISIRSFFIQSTSSFLSYKSSLPLIRYLFFYIGAVYIIKNNSNILKNFTIILSSTFILLLLDSSIQFFSGKNILGNSDNINNRVSSFFDGRFVLGSYIAKLVLIHIFLLNKIGRAHV